MHRDTEYETGRLETVKPEKLKVGIEEFILFGTPRWT